jgi:hypothetical protein
MSRRSTKACPLCGRQIYADHNFYEHNYEAHVKACPRQQHRAMLRAIRKAGQGVAPLPGQLPLPHVDGVREVLE